MCGRSLQSSSTAGSVRRISADQPRVHVLDPLLGEIDRLGQLEAVELRRFWRSPG